MTETKNISRDAYVWGHFGVILFHLIIAGILIYMSFRYPEGKNGKKYLLALGVLLGIVAILSLVPIFRHYGDDYEYVINMD
jgi:hypothetical protein